MFVWLWPTIQMAHQREVLERGIQILGVNGQKRWKRKKFMADPEKGKVIQFPLKTKPQKEIIIDNTDMELRESIIFREYVLEGLVVNFIHILTENGVFTNDKGFIRDVGCLIE